jgi:hypothetical protein
MKDINSSDIPKAMGDSSAVQLARYLKLPQNVPEGEGKALFILKELRKINDNKLIKDKEK